MDILQEMLKVGSLQSDILKQSKFLKESAFVNTGIPMLDYALSGDIDGGLPEGLTVFAGPSKHFKSKYLTVLMASFQRQHKDGTIVFYDSEKGTKLPYLTSEGVDLDRVIHIPVKKVEDLKIDMTQKLTHLDGKMGDGHIMFAVDSVGNLSSKKEIEDAEDNKTTADMTRAKALKSWSRIISPLLAFNGIPCVLINHTYETMEKFSKQIMGGGTGIMYAADNVIFVAKVQDKDVTTKEINGYHFDLIVEKSRYVREKSRFPIYVSFAEGISKDAGILDMAVDFNIIEKSGRGFVIEGEKIQKKNLPETFIHDLIHCTSFVQHMNDRYRLPQ